MLPLDAPPLPGEAFPAYLHRIAALVEVDPRTLYAHLGLRAAGKTVRYVHLALTAAHVHDLARETRTKPADIEGSLVRGYRGLDLRALTGPRADVGHRHVQRDQWIFLSGTRFCPRCLAEDRPWMNSWQLPWTFMCRTHHVLLVGVCPSCGSRPDLVVRTANGSGQSTPLNCRCGHPWVDTAPGSTTTKGLDPLQRLLERAAFDRPGRLWGAAATGHDRLAAWRAAGATAARSPHFPRWAARPFLAPPSDPEVMAAVVRRAAPVMTAHDLSSAADELGQLLLDRPERGAAVIWDTFPRSSPLAPVGRAWLRRSGRTHVRLVRSQHDALQLLPVEMERIPTLPAGEHLPARWRRLRTPDEAMRRAALALAIARLAGAGTWPAAGEALGIDGVYAARLLRYTLNRLGPGAAQELTTAAQAYALEIGAASALAQRPDEPLSTARALRQWDARTRNAPART